MNPDVASWRRQQRSTLIARRAEMTQAERKQVEISIGERLDHLVGELGSMNIGLYWPIKHELNLIPWARDLARRTGVVFCLPVVVEAKSPLEYWRWVPGEPTQPGVWNIPVPARRDVQSPDLVLAPLVGFDGENYRLGYGGGYFDRTLAAAGRPFAAGVGYDFSCLETVFPQTHDIAMDAILTEHRAVRLSRV
jgi:5-formyltetrahydrofolate cyclo-ligase